MCFSMLFLVNLFKAQQNITKTLRLQSKTFNLILLH